MQWKLLLVKFSVVFNKNIHNYLKRLKIFVSILLITYLSKARFSSCTLTKRAFCNRWNAKANMGNQPFSIKPNIKQIYKTVKQYHSFHYIKVEHQELSAKSKIRPVFPLQPIFFQLSLLLSNMVNTDVTKQNKSS